MAADGQILAERVRVALSFFARLRGLMGVPSLDGTDGLYLPGTNSIHMLFMRFPIDCVFVGEEGVDGFRRVVALKHSLPPWRGVVWWVRGARGVAELKAGTLAGAGLQPGDRVRFIESA